MLTIILCSFSAFLCGVFVGGMLIQLDTLKKKNVELENKCDDFAEQMDELQGLLIEQNLTLQKFINIQTRVN